MALPTLSDLAAKIRSYPSLAAQTLITQLSALTDSIAGLSADGTFSCLSSVAKGHVVYVDSADHVAKADADAPLIPAIGVVASKPGTTTALVRFSGIITGAGSFTAGALQYLSTTAGALTETAPAAPNAAAVGIAINTTDLLVFGSGPISYMLRAVTAALGANVVGYDDSGSKTTAATVADALDELYADRLSTSRSVPIHLSNWRIVSSSGDVGNIAAIGGVMASDSDPILRGDSNNSWEIFWAANSVVPIGVEVTLPPDVDDTQDVQLDLVLYSGTTNAATMAVATSWNGGSEVTDSADDSATKSATAHTVTATIDKSDVPSSASYVTIRLTPPSHSTNGIGMRSAKLRYTPKLLS